MKTFLAWVGGIAIVVSVISGVWNVASRRQRIASEAKAEDWALRSFVVYQSSNTNAVFAPPWTVADQGENWVVSSASGLRAVIQKKTGNSKFEPIDE